MSTNSTFEEIVTGQVPDCDWAQAAYEERYPRLQQDSTLGRLALTLEQDLSGSRQRLDEIAQETQSGQEFRQAVSHLRFAGKLAHTSRSFYASVDKLVAYTPYKQAVKQTRRKQLLDIVDSRYYPASMERSLKKLVKDLGKIYLQESGLHFQGSDDTETTELN